MRHDNDENEVSGHGRDIREFQNELFRLQEDSVGLERNRERLEIDVKRERELVAEETKKLAQTKELIERHAKEVEKKEKGLKEIEKQLLNHQMEVKRINQKMRDLRHG